MAGYRCVNCFAAGPKADEDYHDKVRGGLSAGGARILARIHAALSGHQPDLIGVSGSLRETADYSHPGPCRCGDQRVVSHTTTASGMRCRYCKRCGYIFDKTQDERRNTVYDYRELGEEVAD